MASPAAFLFLSFYLSSPPLVFYADKTAAAADLVSREFFSMEGDVAWIVQVSDLHLSAHHPERAGDLAELLGPAMQAIRPDLLLVTGDITDAKNRKKTSTRQDESEWIQYRNSMGTLAEESGFEKRRIFDLRGNHDKYGVPYVGSALDFFSIYSISSQFNRLSTLQSISLEGEDDRRYKFVAIDDTMKIGIRGPSNFFGHPTLERIRAVEEELRHPPSVAKIVFGHFPMSFTASAENGERYESVFASQSVASYLCGHLHSTLGKRLWRLHSDQFWEWELGDWKDFRVIRILSIDGGAVSFLDTELRSRDFQTSILITHPVDSRSMSNPLRILTRNDINALVFSTQPILNVTAKVLDSWRDFRIVEEMPLQFASISSNPTKPLYRAKWNAESYTSASASRYWLQVLAIDREGRKTKSDARPFSVQGKAAGFSPSLLAFLLLYLPWEEVYRALVWANISFLTFLLCLPRCCSRPRNILWFATAVYLVCLLTMPWFWGHAVSENGQLFRLGLSGWGTERLGVPDVMMITLPFLYLVVAPLYLLILASGCRIRSGWLRKALLFAGAGIACIHLKLAFYIMEAYGAAPVALSPAVSWVPLLLLAAAVCSTAKMGR